MRDFVFHFGRKFGEGLVVAVGDKKRIVAEPLIPAQFFDNAAVHRAFDRFRFFAGQSECNDCAELCAAVGFSRKFTQKL